MTHTANNELTAVPGVPAEWPPRPGDIWHDRDGDAWMALARDEDGEPAAAVEMRPTAAGRAVWSDPTEVSNCWGPMRLEYRPGWTRPDRSQIEAEAKKRLEMIAGLRALVDFVEANPDLSARAYGFHGQLNAIDEDEVAQLADRFAVTADDRGSQVSANLSFAPDVRFSMVYFRPAPEADEPLVDERGDAEKTQQVEDDAAERSAIESEQRAELDAELGTGPLTIDEATGRIIPAPREATE